MFFTIKKDFKHLEMKGSFHKNNFFFKKKLLVEVSLLNSLFLFVSYSVLKSKVTIVTQKDHCYMCCINTGHVIH